jgi:hypothetical protein
MTSKSVRARRVSRLNRGMPAWRIASSMSVQGAKARSQRMSGWLFRIS